MTNRPYDLATYITAAVRSITATSSVPETERWVHAENLIRDEVDLVRCEAIADHRLDPDA